MTPIQLAWLTAGGAGLLVGAVIALLFARSRHAQRMAAEARLAALARTALEEKLADMDRQHDALRVELAAAEAQSDSRRDAMAELAAKNAALARAAERIPALEQELADSRAGQERLRTRNLSLEKTVTELTTRLDAEQRQAEEKIALLNDARERMRNEFKVLAERILQEKGKDFADHNRTQMDGLITPLREQLVNFRKRVEDVYDKESRDRAALFNEIGNLKHLNERIGKDALNLTKALKGDVKTMGGWGEVILERVLEASGLEKGRTYETQVRLIGDQGGRYQPDVIVRLPEGRDVIVDAKVSLNAYERYHSAGDDTERGTAIKAHLTSLRNHVRILSEKRYENLEGVRTLDFVLMFVPIEAAFLTALDHDRTLFSDAFEKNVILVSPATLLVTLRTIQNIWRFADQNANALEIARQAGGLVDKFVGFVEALEEVGSQLDRARAAYRTARDRLSTGRGNLVRRAEQLRALGVKASKTLPAAYQDNGAADAAQTDAAEDDSTAV